MDMTVPPANAMEIQRQRQAVGLGVRVPERRRRQRASRPGAQAGQARHVVERRPPLVLRARAPREARRRARACTRRSGSRRRTSGRTTSCAPSTAAVAARTPAGNELPFAQMTGHWSMHSMLHVETRGGLHQVPDRHRRPVRGVHGQGPDLPGQRPRRAGAEALREEGLRRAATRRRRQAGRPVVEGHLGQDGVDRSRHREGRRGLRPRVDPPAAGQDRRRASRRRCRPSAARSPTRRSTRSSPTSSR